MRRNNPFRHIGSAPWVHRYRLTPPAPWRPLTDEEWEQIRPLIVQPNAPGRPLADPRGRLDACLYAACMSGAWHNLPREHGYHETVSRQFRRWAHRGVWDNLLIWASSGRMFSQQLEYMICRAFRRAWRLLGLAGLRLARRAGLLTAMRAPPHWLPDPDLSEFVHKREMAAVLVAPEPPRRPIIARLLAMLRAAQGLCRIPAGSAPA